MIPILFDSGETAFTSNGLGRLADCISCTVTEERNGIYECEFRYPITGELYSQITEGRIIGVIHDDRHDIQPFDIYARTAPIDGVVTFYAHHVSYRLGNVILKPTTATTCVAAMAAIPDNTYNPCPFTFWTDKASRGTWVVDAPAAVRALLSGQQGSILDAFGKGDYEFDRFDVKLYAERGTDAGVSIRYGVNLTDIQQDLDVSTVFTAVVPYWLGEDGTLVTLPEGYVVRDGMAVVPVPLDLTEKWEDAPTVEQLRAMAVSRLNSSQGWIPKENIKVSFIDLAHTEEYKDVAALQRVSLCDKVSVYYGPMGVSATLKVVRTVFNVLTEMYDEIELGDPKNTLAQTIASQFAEATASLPTTSKVYSMLTGAVDNATAQITGAAGGFVRFIYDADHKMQEIVIMDTDDIRTATKVWRWNSGGLGYSSNGYNGPYGTAITQDGAIVADYITAGTMNANILRTGIITSRVGGSYWDLDTGVLMISGVSAQEIAENIGQSVTGLDIEYAQNQSSATAPTTGWSTVAPAWAEGWYIWQRVKTTTPEGTSYSEPTCISGRDGSGAAAGINQATLYLYQRSTTQPTAPAVSMTYTFADGSLTNVPAGWSRTIPSGTDPCWVTSAAAISSDTAVTLAANAWQEPVMMAQNGAAVANVVTFFAVNDSTIPPSTDEFHELGEPVPWTDDEDNIMTDDLGNIIYFEIDEAPVPTAIDPYVWTFQRSTYTDGTVLDSTKAITAVYGEQGVGVAAITEQYYLSTSEDEPVGGSWSSHQPVWTEGTYIWTRTLVRWTDDTTTTTDPILARALNAANEAAAEAVAKADSASAREQLIYHSAVSGTISMDAVTAWVGNTANAQNVWTTTRPVYSTAYPVLFVAAQRQTVEQRAAGEACSCTTPVIDQTTTVIDGGHISTGTIDAGVVNVTNIKAGNITSGTIGADRIGAGSITAGKIASNAITSDKIAAGAVTAAKLDAGVITSINNAASAASAAQSTASGANGREQVIYISKAAGTTSVATNTTWVTNTSDTQNAWRARRPTYDSAYPVLFVATQRQTVAQMSGTSCSCTTPVIDQTTTVIDGGRIIAGSITAGKIAAGAVTADKLAAAVITSIDTAQQTANGANSQEQLIYRSAASGTSSMSPTTTWVTSTADTQNAWRARRPSYSRSYPVLFVATQRRTVGGTVTCTTPVIDQTTTVIDGGRIITGSVTASQIAADAITSAKIAAGAVTASEIAADAVTSAKIAAGAVTASEIASGAVTAAKIAAGAVTADMITTGTLQLGESYWNATSGIYLNKGSISLHNSSNFGFYVGPYGDVAIGAKPSNMSSFSGNRCGFQVNNWGDVKAKAIEFYDANDGTSNFTKCGAIDVAFASSGQTDTGLSLRGPSGATELRIYNNGVDVWHTLKVYGTKSRVASTEQYSDRLLYCYETPSPLFGDVGEGTIGMDGLCYVTLDPVFAQTIATDRYQVFIQKYGPGECYVSERKPGWFVVAGTPGMAFGWELKAKQRDYDQRRLERDDGEFTLPTQTYGEDAARHIEDIQKARLTA